MIPSTIQFISRFLLVIVMLALVPAATANTKGDQLRRIMADISLLNSQMAQRKSDAAGIRDALATHLKEIRGEAIEEMHTQKINTEAQAMKFPRFWFDLVLMGEIQAYMDGYTQCINHYRVACDRLSYLYQQADDDLKIINTLSGMKIEALVSQAQKVLDHYLVDAQTIVLHPGALTIASPPDVLKALNQKG